MERVAQDVLWSATLEELKGLRRDVQELVEVMKQVRGCLLDGEQALPPGRPAQPMLTIPEVAELLRTSPKAVYELIGRGHVPGVVRLGRKLLVRREVLTKALAKGDLYSAARAK